MRKRVVLLSLLAFCFIFAAKAQTQLLLPYNDLAFQSSWANAAVRPMHRFSIGVPVLSSIEIGVINNAFSLRSVTERRDGKLHLMPNQVLAQVQKNKLSQEYFEFGLDLFHFRMAWRRWFFWIAMRNQTTQSLVYPNDLVRLAVEGNKWVVGNRFSLNDMRTDLTNYNELTFGASSPIDEDWVVGGRLSLLMGNINAKLEPKNVGFTVLDDPQLRFVHQFDMDGFARTNGIKYDEKGKPSGVDYASASTYINPSNPGFALSAAATYTVPKLKELSFTFAFTDLGMIHWGSDPRKAQMANKRSKIMGVNGFKDILFNGELNWNLMKSDKYLKDFHREFDKDAKGESYNTWLSPKFYLMARYNILRQTTAGLSFAATVHQGQFYPSVTASIQQGYSALVSGQFAISYNQRSFLNFGAGVVFTPGPCQFYIIADNLYGAINPIDLKATSVRLGFNIVLGPLYPIDQLTQK